MSDAATKKEKVYFTIPDLMERWSVSRATIYREIERGRLKRRHIGGQVRFSAEDVRSYEYKAN